MVYGYQTYAHFDTPQTAVADPSSFGGTRSTFHCDGRVYCSEMHSCAEAKFFLQNCPGVRMDGNDDGIPCEKQWCSSPFAD